MHQYFPRPGYRVLPRNADRRVSVRHEATLETSCDLSSPDNTAWLAEVMDISTGGIGLILDRGLRCGSQLELVLSNGPQCARCTVKVAHIAQLGDGVWFAGCRFNEPLRDCDLQAWV